MVPAPEWLRPQWFIPLFLAFWLCILAGLAFADGWFSLSREFRSDASESGQRFHFCSGALGVWPFLMSSYGKCLFITANEQGFRISILFPFRFFHPPLFIPWTAVDSVERRFMLFLPCTVVRLSRGWPTFAVRGAAARYLIDLYPTIRRNPEGAMPG